MFNKPKRPSVATKHTRTRLVKVGGLSFMKKVRKANPEEKIDNKKERLYYHRNKAKIARQAKLRKAKLERNPRAIRLLEIKQAALKMAKQFKMPLAQAVRAAKSKMTKSSSTKTNVKK